MKQQEIEKLASERPEFKRLKENPINASFVLWQDGFVKGYLACKESLGNRSIVEPITLNELISIFTELKSKMDNGEYEVEFWLGDEQLELESIGHFNVIPNTTITLRKPHIDPLEKP